MENFRLTVFEFAFLCCLLFCFLVIIDIPSLPKYFLTTGISAATNSFFFVCFLFLPFACNLWIFIWWGQMSCHKVFSLLSLHIGTIQWFTMRPQSLNSLACSIYCFIYPQIYYLSIQRIILAQFNLLVWWNSNSNVELWLSLSKNYFPNMLITKYPSFAAARYLGGK